MSESLPHLAADPASAADPTNTPGSLTPVTAPGGGPTNEQLTDRLRFYESFDELIQQNIARSSQLLREAAAKRDEAVAEIAMAKRTVAAERETQRGNLSELLDDVMSIQQAAERLAHRVSDALEQIEFEIEPDGLTLGGLSGGPAAATGSGFGLLSASHGLSTDAEAVHSEIATGVLGQQPNSGATAASPTIGSGTATDDPFTATTYDSFTGANDNPFTVADGASSDAPTAATDAASVPLSDDPFNPERDQPSDRSETPVDAPPVGAAAVSSDDLSEPEPGTGPEAAPLESSADGWREQSPLVDLNGVESGDDTVVAEGDDTAVPTGGEPVMAEDEVTSVSDTAPDWSDVPRAIDAQPVANADATGDSWSEAGLQPESAGLADPTVASTAETVDDLDLSANTDDATSADAVSADIASAYAEPVEISWSATAETQDATTANGTGPSSAFDRTTDTDALTATSVENGVTESATDSEATDEADREDALVPAEDIVVSGTAASTDSDWSEPAAVGTDQPEDSPSDAVETSEDQATMIDAAPSAVAPQPVAETPVIVAANDMAVPDVPTAPAVEEQTTLVLDGVPRAATALAIQRHVLANDAVLRAEVREYYDHRLTLFVTANRPLQVSDLEGWDTSASWEQVAATADRLEMRLEM